MSILESFTDLAVSTTACLSGFSRTAFFFLLYYAVDPGTS